MRAAVSFQQTGCSRRGAAAVEFALILPLLITLVLGCIDFGRFAYYYIAVTNAARAGASYGIMNNYTSSTYSTWVANITQAARDEIAQQKEPGKTLSVTVSTSRESTGLRRVQVLASYPFTTIVPWNWTGLAIPSSVNLQRQVEMRLIR
jgi:Flp pilus assembly protein TadG